MPSAPDGTRLRAEGNSFKRSAFFIFLTMGDRSEQGNGAIAKRSEKKVGAHTGITAEIRDWASQGMTVEDARAKLKEKSFKKSRLSQLVAEFLAAQQASIDLL